MPDNNEVLSVSELNGRIASVVQADRSLRNIYVGGKLVKWNYYEPQDAFYFALGDEKGPGRLEGVLFDQGNKVLPEGIGLNMHVVIKGFVEVYNKGGYHRIRAAAILRDFKKEDEEDFETRYKRLEKKGYFRQHRPLPEFPAKICIITADDSDALKDFVVHIGEKWPMAEILHIPAEVGTSNAVKSLISAFGTANSTDADMIIFGRGGGDKNEIDKVFNSVELADAITASRLPTVSAIGHTANITIADFAADVKVDTPTDAHKAVPDVFVKLRELEVKKNTLKVSLSRVVDHKIAAVRIMDERLKSMSPLHRLTVNEQKLISAAERIRLRAERIIEAKEKSYLALASEIRLGAHEAVGTKERELLHTAELIEATAPKNVLARGYSITYGGGGVVKSAADVKPGDRLRIALADGTVNVVVESTER